MGSAGGLLVGRKAYEIFAGYWPHQGEGVRFASFLNCGPKYVASRTLPDALDWANSHLLSGDVTEAIRGMKEEDGGDLASIHRSAEALNA